ncbi:MAG: hypothetical protein RR420_01215 [Anaerovoracaceae bacterium]
MSDNAPEIKELEQIEAAENFKENPNEVISMLADKILSKINDYKAIDDNFYIVDRFNSPNFSFAIRDAFYNYNINVVLCEKLIPSSLCRMESSKVPFLTKEQRLRVDEFNEFSKNITDNMPNADDVSDKVFKDVSDKIAEQAKNLSGVLNNVEYTTIDTVTYTDESTGIIYPVIKLSSIEDEPLKALCLIYANYVYSTTKVIMPAYPIGKMSLMGYEVPGYDYIDIVAIIN